MFLNPALLWGLLAVSAPIIIHLIHRSKVRPLDWGAMMFLEELMAERARSIKLRSLLLLLIRTLLVGCLGLAMCQPAVKWAAGASRSSRVSSVILLDDSASMRAGRPRSAWQEAQELSGKYLDHLNKGDDVTVMYVSTAAKESSAASLFDLERAKEQIRKAEPSYEAADMPRAVDAALQQLENRHNPRRELLIVSDLQAEGWMLEDGNRWTGIANRRKHSRFEPFILLASVQPQPPANVAVTEITPSRQVLDPFSEATFHVTVANEGPEDVPEAAVTFLVDGAPKTTQTVELPRGERRTLDFPHKFARPGSACVGAKIRAAADQFDEDNELYLSAPVIDRLPILIVDGDRRESVLESESGFLRLALAPKDSEDPDWRTVLDPTVMDVTELRGADLSRYRVVVLANVAGLQSSVVSDLERFVVGGGGLLVALGDRVHAEAYNRDLYRQGAGLLPVSVGRTAFAAEKLGSPALLTAGAGAEPKTANAVQLGAIVSRVAALDLFQPEKGQEWTSGRVYNYFTTSAPTGDLVRVLANYSDGRAALVQKRLGEGKVTLLTTAADMDWSDLPAQPFYVPLMQSLVLDLAALVTPPRNLRVGQALSCVDAGPSATKPHLLYLPQGAPVILPMQRQGSLSVFTYDQTRRPGLYTVAPEGGGPETRVHYAVAMDRRESRMARLDAEQRSRLVGDACLGAKLAESETELLRLIGTGAGGYPLAAQFLWAALFFCFLEIYVTRRWS